LGKGQTGIEGRGEGLDWITVDEDDTRITLEIKAFGDFNGDGIEDILLFKSCFALEGTMRDNWMVFPHALNCARSAKGLRRRG